MRVKVPKALQDYIIEDLTKEDKNVFHFRKITDEVDRSVSLSFGNNIAEFEVAREPGDSESGYCMRSRGGDNDEDINMDAEIFEMVRSFIAGEFDYIENYENFRTCETSKMIWDYE